MRLVSYAAQDSSWRAPSQSAASAYCRASPISDSALETSVAIKSGLRQMSVSEATSMMTARSNIRSAPPSAAFGMESKTARVTPSSQSSFDSLRVRASLGAERPHVFCEWLASATKHAATRARVCSESTSAVRTRTKVVVMPDSISFSDCCSDEASTNTDDKRALRHASRSAAGAFSTASSVSLITSTCSSCIVLVASMVARHRPKKVHIARRASTALPFRTAIVTRCSTLWSISSKTSKSAKSNLRSVSDLVYDRIRARALRHT
mmetsp:Transcript_22008/g.71151  ORF Transcript_22008/g.71151 Transcript_22008/m.71151 type:complete len:265 (-) Transcript_22008:25-819(-)